MSSEFKWPVTPVTYINTTYMCGRVQISPCVHSADHKVLMDGKRLIMLCDKHHDEYKKKLNAERNQKKENKK